MNKKKANLVLALDKILEEKDLSQIELAHMTGIGKNTISRMSVGTSQVRLSSLTKICQALDLEPGDLIRWQPVNGQ